MSERNDAFSILNPGHKLLHLDVISELKNIIETNDNYAVTLHVNHTQNTPIVMPAPASGYELIVMQNKPDDGNGIGVNLRDRFILQKVLPLLADSVEGGDFNECVSMSPQGLSFYLRKVDRGCELYVPEKKKGSKRK